MHLIEQLKSLTAELQRMGDAPALEKAHDVPTVARLLEMYVGAVRELRTVALDARKRIEHVERVVAEAHAVARDRRRQAIRAAGKHRQSRSAGADA